MQNVAMWATRVVLGANTFCGRGNLYEAFSFPNPFLAHAMPNAMRDFWYAAERIPWRRLRCSLQDKGFINGHFVKWMTDRPDRSREDRDVETELKKARCWFTQRPLPILAASLFVQAKLTRSPGPSFLSIVIASLILHHGFSISPALTHCSNVPVPTTSGNLAVEFRSTTMYSLISTVPFWIPFFCSSVQV